MARIYQLDPVAGDAISSDHEFGVDRAGDNTRRASQSQAMKGLLSQLHDPAFVYPAGSFGQIFLSSTVGSIGSIDSFDRTAGSLLEMGTVVSNPTLSWTLSPMTVLSQGITGPLTVGVVLGPSQRSVTLSGDISADATWGLSVTNTNGTLNRSTSLIFGHYVHYGRGPSTTLNAAAILALSGSQLATDINGDYVFGTGTDPNAYTWICYPDSWGAVSLIDMANLMPIAVLDAGVVSVTNVSGHTRNYRCLRSLNALHGAITMRAV